MGIKGTVRRSTDGDFIHANVDIDLIITEEPEYGSLEKPSEIFNIIEHFCLGKRRWELLLLWILLLKYLILLFFLQAPLIREGQYHSTGLVDGWTRVNQQQLQRRNIRWLLQ